MNYRLYTALYYLNKGIEKGFWDLLCIKRNNNVTLYNNNDIKSLNDEGYIIFKSPKNIIITKKTEMLLDEKYKFKNENNEIKITDDYVIDFQKGFPAKRFDLKENIKKQLKRFVSTHNFSLDVMFKAKEKYVNEQSSENYTYTKKVTNFIITELENYCIFIENDEKSNTNVTDNNIFMD